MKETEGHVALAVCGGGVGVIVVEERKESRLSAYL